LSSLLPSRPAPIAAAPAPAAAEPTKLSLDAIITNPNQPRRVFNPNPITELADSIRAHGVLQPLIVRRMGDKFQIVAGERRWRAARLAGLSEVPVLIQQVTDNEALEIALIENIQREDLNPIETAHAFDRLSREVGLSQEEIGKRTGKDRVTIANLIRLLRLPREVQELLAEQKISMGHARAMLALANADDQITLANSVAAQGLSVRAVEARVQKLISEKTAGKVKVQDPNVRAATEELERLLGTRVRIVETNEKRGRIEIEYYSPEELDRLYQFIVK